MGTSKLIDKLDEFLDFPKKKRRKKHDHLLEIIAKLEKRKSKLQCEAKLEREDKKSRDRYRDLTRELKVVSKLIKKAKQHDVSA